MRFLNRSVGRLSRYRRRPLAGVAVLLVALAATGGLYALFSPSSSSAAQGEDQASLAAEGKQLFTVNCSTCHGLHGEGITTQNHSLYGPSLIGVGAAAVDFQVGTGRMPMAQPGAQVEVKRGTYSQHQIDALAAYVASLAPGPAIPDKDEYDPSTFSSAQEKQKAVTLGGQIFLTNCTACHNFTGAGGAMPRGGHAPRILDTSPRHIYEAMLTGPQSMDTFSNGNISPEGKKAVIAYVESMRKQPGFGGYSLGGLGPVTEGMMAWIGGLGVLVAFAVWIAAHTTRTNQKKGSAK
ncbi:MAG: c-type cytochrome [Nocardioides sp.]|nr:c-type cytochrome [Nocardioides sp.]